MTDIATKTIYSVPGASRRLAGAAGSAGVTFTVVVNLGKTASVSSITKLQASLLANFNATSPAFMKIKGDVATAAGLPSANLLAVPPTPADIVVGGSASGLGPVIVVSSSQDVSGVLAIDEGIGAAIGFAIVVLAFALYSYRSVVVHGVLPWQRNRKREKFELKELAAREVEERIFADSVLTTITNPVATQGKSALTLRVPKAVSAEIEALRAKSEADAKDLKALRAKQEEMEREQAERVKVREATSFAPMPVTAPPPPSAPANTQMWREVSDPVSGRSYWFNTGTRETSWTRPAGV